MKNRGKQTLAFLTGVCIVLVFVHTSLAHQEADSLPAAIRGLSGFSILSALLDLLLLAGVVTCFVISIRVKSFLRDGELASGWNLFSISFVLLFLAQLLSLFSSVELLNISSSVVSSLRLLFVISLGSGIYFMKKVLS